MSLPVDSNQNGAIVEDGSEGKRGAFKSGMLRHRCERNYALPGVN